MPSFLYATNRFSGNGITTQFEFAFSGGYMARTDVKAYIENNTTFVRTPVAVLPGMFVNATTVNLGIAAPVGSTMVIYRDTPKGAPLVDFIGGSRITEANLDKVAQQAVFIGAETSDATVPEQVAAIFTAASAASTAAAEASLLAASADNSAEAAQNSLSSANLSAASAATARTAAEAAQAAALVSRNSASTDAALALTRANNAATSAAGAATSATNASSSQTAAATSASTATAQAGTASTSATNASNSASAAGVNASNAATSAAQALVSRNEAVAAVAPVLAAAYIAAASTVIGSGVSSLVFFETEDFDTNNALTASRFTAPIAGYYNVKAQIAFTVASNYVASSLTLRRNGTNYQIGPQLNITEANTVAFTPSLDSVLFLNQGDFVEIFCIVFGTTTSIDGGATRKSSWFIQRLRGA